MEFPAAIEAQLTGSTVRADTLVEFEFLSQTIRLHNGTGPRRTNDGKVWEGLRGLGEIDGLEQSVNGVASTQSFTLSGVDARFAAIPKGVSAEYFRRPVRVFLQFFDEGWQPLDDPVALSVRLMDSIKAQRRQADQGPVYTVSITAETPFVTRSRPRYSYWTDRDQQLRFARDIGLSEVAGIEGKVIKFPSYSD